MKKEDFIKLGVPENVAEQCEAALNEEMKGFIPKSRFNEVNEENKALKQSVSERDNQLDELKKSSGDNEALKKQIEDLQAQNAEQKKSYEAQMNQLKLDNAIDTALTAAGAKNGKAVKALLDMAKVALDKDGKLTGLDEQVSAVQKSDGYLFAEKQQPPQFKGFQPGAGADNQGGNVDYSKMSLDELSAFMTANPDVKII